MSPSWLWNVHIYPFFMYAHHHRTDVLFIHSVWMSLSIPNTHSLMIFYCALSNQSKGSKAIHLGGAAMRYFSAPLNVVICFLHSSSWKEHLQAAAHPYWAPSDGKALRRCSLFWGQRRIHTNRDLVKTMSKKKHWSSCTSGGKKIQLIHLDPLTSITLHNPAVHYSAPHLSIIISQSGPLVPRSIVICNNLPD